MNEEELIEWLEKELPDWHQPILAREVERRDGTGYSITVVRKDEDDKETFEIKVIVKKAKEVSKHA